MKRLYLILTFSIFLIGCENLKNYEFISSETPANYTNSSINTSINSALTPIANSIDMRAGTFYFISKSGAAYLSESTNLLIDSSGYDVITAVRKYNKKVDAYVFTLNTAAKMSTSVEAVYSLKPKVIYDNGIPNKYRNNYLLFAERLLTTHQTISVKKQVSFTDVNMEFYPPYAEMGFCLGYIPCPDSNYDSIPVEVGKMLYMSNCYGLCENTVDARADILVLANEGHCPTNSVNFILDTGATTIIGDELCPELNVTEYLGIGFKSFRDAPVIISDYVPVLNLSVVFNETH